MLGNRADWKTNMDPQQSISYCTHKTKGIHKKEREKCNQAKISQTTNNRSAAWMVGYRHKRNIIRLFPFHPLLLVEPRVREFGIATVDFWFLCVKRDCLFLCCCCVIFVAVDVCEFCVFLFHSDHASVIIKVWTKARRDDTLCGSITMEKRKNIGQTAQKNNWKKLSVTIIIR